MPNHSEEERRCNWSLFFIPTHISGCESLDSEAHQRGNECRVVTAYPASRKTLQLRPIHHWHRDGCFRLSYHDKALARILFRVFFRRRCFSLWASVCVCVCVAAPCVSMTAKKKNACRTLWMTWQMFLAKWSIYQARPALLVNEVREPQSTQSTPLPPTWTNGRAWAITPPRLPSPSSSLSVLRQQRRLPSTTSIRGEEAAGAHAGNSVAFIFCCSFQTQFWVFLSPLIMGEKNDIFFL